MNSTRSADPESSQNVVGNMLHATLLLYMFLSFFLFSLLRPLQEKERSGRKRLPRAREQRVRSGPPRSQSRRAGWIFGAREKKSGLSAIWGKSGAGFSVCFSARNVIFCAFVTRFAENECYWHGGRNDGSGDKLQRLLESGGRKPWIVCVGRAMDGSRGGAQRAWCRAWCPLEQETLARRNYGKQSKFVLQAFFPSPEVLLGSSRALRVSYCIVYQTLF